MGFGHVGRCGNDRRRDRRRRRRTWAGRRAVDELEKDAGLAGGLGLLRESLALGLGRLVFAAGSRGRTRRDAELALAFQDRSAKIAGKRRAELRRAGMHLPIVAGKTGETVGGRLALGVVKLLALLADPHPGTLERQPGHAEDAAAGDCRDADQQLALEANGAARRGFEHQGLRVMLGRLGLRRGGVRHLTLP